MPTAISAAMAAGFGASACSSTSSRGRAISSRPAKCDQRRRFARPRSSTARLPAQIRLLSAAADAILSRAGHGLAAVSPKIQELLSRRPPVRLSGRLPQRDLTEKTRPPAGLTARLPRCLWRNLAPLRYVLAHTLCEEEVAVY